MFTPMLHHVHTYEYTYVTACSHLCYTMFTHMFSPMLHHAYTYVYTYVTPCSHLLLHLCYTMFTPIVPYSNRLGQGNEQTLQICIFKRMSNSPGNINCNTIQIKSSFPYNLVSFPRLAGTCHTQLHFHGE